MAEQSEVGIELRLNGPERGLHDVARQLRAIDRAWAFSASVEAYQRGYQDIWARQTQYAPRPEGLRIAKQSPVVVELWEVVDVPTIIGGTFGAFAYVVTNIEKIVTIPERIRTARLEGRVRIQQLSRELEELEASDEIILREPVEPPVLAAPGEDQEAIKLERLDRDAEIAGLRLRLDRLEREQTREQELEHDWAVLDDRARSVQAELERVEPEVIRTYGIGQWRARRRRRL